MAGRPGGRRRIDGPVVESRRIADNVDVERGGRSIGIAEQLDRIDAIFFARELRAEVENIVKPSHAAALNAQIGLVVDKLVVLIALAAVGPGDQELARLNSIGAGRAMGR